MKKSISKPGYGKILDAWNAPDDGAEPIGCVTTTFTFSPGLFEEECLGRFVQLETDPQEDGAAYVIEREEKFSKLECAAVLVDQHHARGMRSLRWDLLSVRIPKGIMHAKISLLLWSNRARVIVGSANLTKQGYRLNHEVYAALDFHNGAETPIQVMQESLAFLRNIV